MDGEQTAWWKEPQLLCLLLVVFLAHAWRVDTVTIRGEEPRRIAIGQDMLRTGDWIVPRIQGEPVHFRPPLQNWLIAFSIAVHGDASHWSVRLPGMLAVLLTCVWIYAYARQFVGPLGAFTSAAAFATMVQVLELGKLAETESIFTLFICASLLTWHLGLARGWSDYRLWITAYSLAGLGALAKGMQAPVYLFTTTFVYLLWTGDWRRFVSVGHLLGLALFGCMFGLWFVPYWAQMGWDKAVLTVVGETTMRLDYSNSAEIVEHVWRYPLWVASCMLPWSIFLGAYLRSDFRTTIGLAQPMVHFMTIALAVAFPTCWIVPSANARYFMPLYPCAALLIGLAVERSVLASEDTSLRWHWTLLTGVMGIAVIGLGIGLVVAKVAGASSRVIDAQSTGDLLLFAVAALALGSMIIYFCRADHGASLLALSVLVAIGGTLVYQNIIRHKSIDVETPVANLKQRLPDTTRLVSFGQANHRFAFYLNRPIDLAPWPKTESAQPAPDSYFCFEVDRPEKGPPEALPFAWEKIEVLWMDRYPDQVESFVVVGRRLPQGALARGIP